MFYVPVLFSSLGTGRSTALLNTVVIGAVNVGCTMIAVGSWPDKMLPLRRLLPACLR